MSLSVTCASCAFFRPPGGLYPRANGQCRRHAPVIDRGDAGIRTVWPMIGDNQWCGEHAELVTSE